MANERFDGDDCNRHSRRTNCSIFGKWQIGAVSLFGSVLREDFGPESDVDVLVDFESEASLSLLDMIAAEQELATILGRPVDLLDRSAVERSENWIRRRGILNSAR